MRNQAKYDRIDELLRRGESMPVIATRLGVTVGAVKGRKNRLKILERVGHLVRSGLSTASIMTEVNDTRCSRRLIAGVRESMMTDPDYTCDYVVPSGDPDAEILEMLKVGKSNAEVTTAMDGESDSDHITELRERIQVRCHAG